MTTVKYTKKYIEDEGFYLPEYGNKRVEDIFIKQYSNTLSKIFSLSPRASKLLEYLVLTMPKTNIIRTDKYARDAFNNALKHANLDSYSDSNIVKAISELVSKEFLIKEMRSVYLVNPEYYDKGSNDKRLRKVQILLEFQSGVRPSLSIENQYEDLLTTKKE